MKKTKILVLDRFTNGHEAALRFIRQQGWKAQECDIVFCGNHKPLLQKLSEGPAYAVVPVLNSSKGEIVSVTSEISRLKELGYDFKVVAELPLRIRHYLMAAPHVKKIDQVDRVISKTEAIGQCDRWLKDNGLAEQKRSPKHSTGAAALHVSKIKPTARYNLAAIAPKAAAKAYGLTILVGNIQDDPKNTTTFHLLQNTAVPEKCTVGIIGINGQFGQVLKVFFESLGLNVIGSDRKVPTEFTNIQVVKKADVVVFAITIKRTVATINSVIKYTRVDQLLMDITSVKLPAIKAMLKGKAQIVGLHPMFAPSVSFDGQTIVVCPERLTDPRWKTWVVNLLAATGAKRKWSNGAAHDKYMVTVQVGPQSANFISAALLMDSNVSVTESLAFTSPFYRSMFTLMGRLLTQSPELFGQIFMQNPETVPMLERRIKLERHLIEIIRKKDQNAFAQWFRKIQAHFGSENIRNANEFFMRFNAVTKTVEGTNSIILEFASRDNKPGLLEHVLTVFRRKGVNLTGINFVSLDAKRNQFSITTEESKESESVIQSIRIIENWKGPKIRMVS